MPMSGVLRLWLPPAKADEFRAAGDTANADKFDNLAKVPGQADAG